MRILLIEDDKKAVQLLTRGLQEEGFVLDVAFSAEEGDAMACSTTYDLIVLDWRLPGADGVSLCRELRRQKVQTPILMLTARDALSDRVAGLNSGADDYLTKPFAFEELLARIHALLRRSELTRPVVLSFADLELDPVKHRVTRAGARIELTQKEYAILEALMRRAGDIVTRSRLAEHVWDNEQIDLDNLIDAHIRNLRRKIDLPGSQAIVLTVRGRGFRLALRGDEGA
jgi:DNA-binding response OmpR family regulator